MVILLLWVANITHLAFSHVWLSLYLAGSHYVPNSPAIPHWTDVEMWCERQQTIFLKRHSEKDFISLYFFMKLVKIHSPITAPLKTQSSIFKPRGGSRADHCPITPVKHVGTISFGCKESRISKVIMQLPRDIVYEMADTFLIYIVKNYYLVIQPQWPNG